MRRRRVVTLPRIGLPRFRQVMTRVVRRGLWQLIVALCALLAGFAGAQPQPAEPFAAGSAAFSAGDYTRALGLFQAARARGLDSAALAYNIGVCQYRLGNHAAAESTFADLAMRFPGFRALAEYNRGLVLLALGRRSDARAAFGTAQAEGDERLAALAAAALVEAGDGQSKAPAVRWLGYFGASLGHDDNVALVDELSLPANVAAASPFTDVMGYASRRFDTRVPLRLELTGYAVRYADDHLFDQSSLRADAVFQWSAGDAWRFEAGPYLASSTLDGDGFEHTRGAQLRAVRNLSERLAFDVRFAYDDIESPTARYEFVAGRRERLRFGLEHRNAGRRLRAQYELESQSRADAGVSPDRGRILLGLGQSLGARWLFDGSVAHRASRYRDLATPRNESLTELTLALRRELRSAWSFDTSYRWADNSANIAQFDYTSRRIGLGISRAF